MFKHTGRLSCQEPPFYIIMHMWKLSKFPHVYSLDFPPHFHRLTLGPLYKALKPKTTCTNLPYTIRFLFNTPSRSLLLAPRMCGLVLRYISLYPCAAYYRAFYQLYLLWVQIYLLIGSIPVRFHNLGWTSCSKQTLSPGSAWHHQCVFKGIPLAHAGVYCSIT